MNEYYLITVLFVFIFTIIFIIKNNEIKTKGILNDKEIEVLAVAGMITPFINKSIKDDNGYKVLSYGLSSYGYDLRMSSKDIYLFKSHIKENNIIDPKKFDLSLVHKANVMKEANGEKYVIIPPNSFLLGNTVETVKFPNNVFGIVQTKSTIARCGITTIVTPIEPGFEGTITLEYANTSGLPAKMYLDEGCAQLIFFKGNRPKVTYADRKGKYQGQGNHIVFPKV